MLRNRILLRARAIPCHRVRSVRHWRSRPTCPKYDGNKLIFPDGFRTGWLFVGSNIGLQYKGEGATVLKDGHPLTAPRQPQVKAPGPPVEFHNVYITPDGYAGFRTSKTAFPDRTMLVIDRYSAQKKEPHNILSAGSFDGDQYGALVAVKNSTTPGGLGSRQNRLVLLRLLRRRHREAGRRASRRRDVSLSACAACHKKNGLVDNVWVQFYPMLRDLLKSGGLS